MDDFTGHTPGPWQIVIDGFSADVLICDEKRGYTVAFLGFGQSQSLQIANARLIAAAPDLLAERDRLRAEVERLREALLNIADMPANPAYDWYELVEEMASTARRAALARESTP